MPGRGIQTRNAATPGSFGGETSGVFLMWRFSSTDDRGASFSRNRGCRFGEVSVVA